MKIGKTIDDIREDEIYASIAALRATAKQGVQQLAILTRKGCGPEIPLGDVETMILTAVTMVEAAALAAIFSQNEALDLSEMMVGRLQRKLSAFEEAVRSE